MIKLLNGDLIAVEDSTNDREICRQLGEEMQISPYRIRLFSDEESEESKESKENIRYALVLEKDQVKMPCAIDQYTKYEFLQNCTNVQILSKCLDICRQTSYSHDANSHMWLDLLLNPHPLVVDHLLAIPELHNRTFYRTLSGNPSDRVVDWLIDEHPERIHMELFFRNTNPRAIEYVMTHVSLYTAHQFMQTHFEKFIRKVARTTEQIQWLYTTLVPSGVFTEFKLTWDLCLNESDAFCEVFIEKYPTPSFDYMFPVLPRSHHEKMIPYYLYYLDKYSSCIMNDTNDTNDTNKYYNVVNFAASHPHPAIVGWWVRQGEKILTHHKEYPNRANTLWERLVSKHKLALHSNPSEEMVDWLSNQFFCCFDWFALNRNPRALERCLKEWRKGWPGNEAMIRLFAYGGMHPRAMMFLFNEYPDECRQILVNPEGKSIPYGMDTLAMSDEWEWVK